MTYSPAQVQRIKMIRRLLYQHFRKQQREKGAQKKVTPEKSAPASVRDFSRSEV